MSEERQARSSSVEVRSPKWHDAPVDPPTPDWPTSNFELRASKFELAFSLAELTIVLVLVAVVLSSIGAVLLDQRRFYASLTQITDTRNAARAALEVLSGELRPLNPSQGDLYAIGPDSIALRAMQGFGIVCGQDGARLHIWQLSGVFGDSWRDSVLIYTENSPATRSDDEWRSVGIAETAPASDDECLDALRPGIELSLDQDPGQLPVGTPVRAFRPFVYSLYRASDGRWWLGQRLRSGQVQPVTGPFEPPDAGGLLFEYLTREGTLASGPEAVAQVRIRLKARSARRLRLPLDAGYYTDTLSSLVFLRNSVG